MNLSIEQLKIDLSGLPVAERADLAFYLLQSLEADDEGVQEAWRAELSRRITDIRTGKVVGKPVEHVLARLRETYP